MKKVLIIVGAVAGLVLTGLVALFLALGQPYDPEASPLHGEPPPPGLARTIGNPAAKHTTTFVEKAAETDGARTLLKIELEPGGGNDPHYHREFTERFVALSGTLGVEVEGETFLLEEGQSHLVERYEEHRFFNPGEAPITFHVEIEPGNPGFERALYIIYGLADDGHEIHDDLHHLAILAVTSDTGMRGPLQVIRPFIHRLAGRAQRLGVEEELLQRYYLGRVEQAGEGAAAGQGG